MICNIYHGHCNHAQCQSGDTVDVPFEKEEDCSKWSHTLPLSIHCSLPSAVTTSNFFYR